MFLGAWLDLGIDTQAWQSMLDGLHLEGVDIRIQRVFKQGIGATKVDVLVTDEQLWYDGDVGQQEIHEHVSHHDSVHLASGGHTHNHTHSHSSEPDDDHSLQIHHPHRHYEEIVDILRSAHLPAEVREMSLRAFASLAEAEGRVHGLSPSQVHFHEVGAVDAIIDVVGTMAGWYLAGMPQCYVSPIEVGGGTVLCAHGRMPVPAPATANLLEGLTTYSSGCWGETVTPTGAALLRVLSGIDKGPALSLTTFVTGKMGYGAGNKELPVANVLRIRLGTLEEDSTGLSQPAGDGVEASRDDVVELLANLDDMTPEWVAHVLDRLLAEGALDAWLTPAVMKKGRPGWVLHVLAHPATESSLTRVLFRETSTLGVRRQALTREVLARRWVPVETPFGAVRVKVAERNGEVYNTAPEYEDCLNVAARAKVALKEVYQAAWAAYNQQK